MRLRKGLLVGINVVIISKISFGAIVPDFFNKAKSARDVFLGSFVGFIPAGMMNVRGRLVLLWLE